MDINYFLGRLKPELNYLTAGVFDRVKAVDSMREDAKKALTAQFADLHDFTARLSDIRNLCFKKYPAESIKKKQDMEYWWDHIAGGWSPDKLASVR
jgi:hypothetical protein